MSMMRSSVSLQEMLNQSIQVVTNPSVPTFEKYEKRGTVTNAAIYVAIGAVISGIFGIFTGGIGGLIAGVISALIVFFVFTGLVYLIGKQMTGTGTWDEVAYTFSLFTVPLTIVSAILTLLLTIFNLIPILGALAGLAGLFIWIFIMIIQVYFGYLAVQSSMNLRDNQAMITLALAWLGTIVALGVLGGITGLFIR
jgi:hypothetical protein